MKNLLKRLGLAALLLAGSAASQEAKTFKDAIYICSQGIGEKSPEISQIREKIFPRIVSRLERKGYGSNNRYSVGVYRSFFATPLEEKESQQYLDYCKQVYGFLKQEFPKVEIKEPKWKVVGQSGEGIYLVENGYERIDLEVRIGNILVDEFSCIPISVKGSTGVISSNGSYILLSNKEMPQIAPFSEILHTITSESTMRAFGISLEAHIADETIAEGLASTCLRRFGEKNKIEVEEAIRQHSERLVAQNYSNVPKAKKFLETRNPQEVLLDYLKDPRGTMESIVRE